MRSAYGGDADLHRVDDLIPERLAKQVLQRTDIIDPEDDQRVWPSMLPNMLPGTGSGWRTIAVEDALPVHAVPSGALPMFVPASINAGITLTNVL
jgi:hypothetical protein